MCNVVCAYAAATGSAGFATGSGSAAGSVAGAAGAATGSAGFGSATTGSAAAGAAGVSAGRNQKELRGQVRNTHRQPRSLAQRLVQQLGLARLGLRLEESSA